jgi:hypothetical protein
MVFKTRPTPFWPPRRVERPGRVVRFARLIRRRGRVLADLRSAPSSAAISSLPWLPRSVIWHNRGDREARAVSCHRRPERGHSGSGQPQHEHGDPGQGQPQHEHAIALTSSPRQRPSHTSGMLRVGSGQAAAGYCSTTRASSPRTACSSATWASISAIRARSSASLCPQGHRPWMVGHA